MPQEVIETLEEALDNLQGDETRIAEARKWVKWLDEAVIELEPAELEELKEAIAISEGEDKQGISYTHEEAKGIFAERLALHKSQKQVEA